MLLQSMFKCQAAYWDYNYCYYYYYHYYYYYYYCCDYYCHYYFSYCEHCLILLCTTFPSATKMALLRHQAFTRVAACYVLRKHCCESKRAMEYCVKDLQTNNS